jgi:hypothetical protein
VGKCCPADRGKIVGTVTRPHSVTVLATVRYEPVSKIQSGMYQQRSATRLKAVESRLPEPPGRLSTRPPEPGREVRMADPRKPERFSRDLPAGLSPRPASSRRLVFGEPMTGAYLVLSSPVNLGSSPCTQGRDAESHPTPRGKRHIASLSGKASVSSDALPCPLRPNDAGRPDRRGTSTGGHRPSNPATRQWCVSSSNARNQTESMRGSSTHQDVALQEPQGARGCWFGLDVPAARIPARLCVCLQPDPSTPRFISGPHKTKCLRDAGSGRQCDTPRPLWGRGVPRLPPHQPSSTPGGNEGPSEGAPAARGPGVTPASGPRVLPRNLHLPGRRPDPARSADIQRTQHGVMR